MIRAEARYPAIGLPVASTSRALAVPQGWSWTVSGPGLPTCLRD